MTWTQQLKRLFATAIAKCETRGGKEKSIAV
jgi:hypothetical protein